MRKLDCPDPEIQTRYIIKFTIVSNECLDVFCFLFLLCSVCLLLCLFFFLNATFWSEPSYLVLKSSDSVRA